MARITFPPSWLDQRSPLMVKADKAIACACEQLPMRLAARIDVIRFGPEGAAHPVFEVVYKGGKTVVFDDVDTFPADADIARIALECP